MNKYYNLLGLFIFFSFCSLIAHAQNYQVVYQLKNYYSTSEKIRMEVNTSRFGAFILDKSRYYWSDHRPVKDVFCADDDRLIIYGTPQTCSVIYWNINFYREPSTGIGGRTKDDYYFNNGQWLLMESKNFPRFRGDPPALVCINQKNCQPLPIKHKLAGFLFLIWGKTPTFIDVAGVKFEIFADKQAEAMIDKQTLMQSTAPNITYLNKVFRSKFGNYIKKPIKIAMLAHNVSRFMKNSGGTAGDHAFVVNYYVYNNQLVTNWEDRLIKFVLHEYVHIIAPCSLFPYWTCESLADYYSYKSLTEGKTNLIALNYWAKYGVKNPYHKLGLYRIAQKYKQTRQEIYSSLFYLKGASFWNELDLLLHQKNDNLDNYINLLTVDDHNQIVLPKVFVDKMIEIVGEADFKTLENYYLK